MEKRYVLALDQSTQGTKAILFDGVGGLVCRVDVPHQQIVNEKGWVSHDLNEIYHNCVQAVRDVIEQSGVDAEEIACLGISNQRETSAAWHRHTGEPLALAIVWQCTRAEDVCERIRNIETKEKNEGVEKVIQIRTGLPLSTYFPAAKYAWLQENVEAVVEAKKEGALCLGTIDSWLLYKLTDGKVYATDYSNASRTQLFNIHTLEWDSEICDWFGIDATMLPNVCESSMKYGVTDLDGYFQTPIPICGLIGDSQGALFAQGCIHKGMMKATYGTGSSVMMNVGNLPICTDSGLATSIAWGLDGSVNYVLEGNINYSGAVITWLKDDVGLIQSPAETQELAEHANPSDNTYLVPAFSGLGAPYWKPDVKAILYGMSRTTGKREIVKAALDSIAYQITDVVEMMRSEDGIEVRELCVDGGATANQYLMQFQSDMLQTTVSISECEEASALGASYMAGICCGMYSLNQCMKRNNHIQYLPKIKIMEREIKYTGWKDTIAKII